MFTVIFAALVTSVKRNGKDEQSDKNVWNKQTASSLIWKKNIKT